MTKLIIKNDTTPSTPASGTTAVYVDSTTKRLVSKDDSGTETSYDVGGGDVVGPASAVDSNVVMFDTTTGKLLKDSGVTLSGSNTGDQTVSNLTTKGDIEAYSTVATRLGVGTDTYVLTADSAEATGLKWAVAAAATVYSNPDGSYANSERFGASASVTGADSTVIGYNASAAANCTAIGSGAISTGATSMAIGKGASCTGNYTTAVGFGALCANAWGTAVGRGAAANANDSVVVGGGSGAAFQAGSITLGRSAFAVTANSINFGSVSVQAKNMFIGMGETASSASIPDISIRPTRPITQTDVAGGDFLLMGAGSTGTAIGSSVKIQTQTAVSGTGQTANTTWVDQIEVNGSSEIIMTAKDAATADGSLWNNSISFYLDETGNTLVVKAKYAAGTVKTGTVALA